MKLRMKWLMTPVLIFPLALFFISSEPAFGLSDELLKVRIERGIDSPMRDGVKLAANVYRPDAPGKFPVILIQLPTIRKPMGHIRPSLIMPLKKDMLSSSRM